LLFLIYVCIAGYNSKKIKLVSFVNAIQLVTVLSGNVAKDIRSGFVRIVSRYLAGDKTLVRELHQNAQSTAPINAMAREALGISTNDNKEQVVASGDFAKFAIDKFNEISKSNSDMIKAIVESKDGYINDIAKAREDLAQAKDAVVKAKEETIRVQAGVIQVQQDAVNLIKSLLGNK